MSVVNQMLRDLDARGARGGRSVAVAGLAVPAGAGRRRPRVTLLTLLLACALGSAALGWTTWPAAGTVAAPSALAQPIARPVAQPIAQPIAPPIARPIDSPQPRNDDAPTQARVSAPTVLPVALAAPTITPTPERPPVVATPPIATAKAPRGATPKARALRDVVALASAEVAPHAAHARSHAAREGHDTSTAWDAITTARAAWPAAPLPTSTASAPPLSMAAAPQKQFALVDRLQAARELWQAGQGEAATALLREALDTPRATDAPTLRVAAVRELARMDLVQREPARALQTLEAHASELAGDALAWSLRGNAAQRLGRHAEAASAFEAAVRLQGEDTRSMLGAAVSLAAAGDLPRAREWASRARRLGTWPADVAAYLKQLGIEPDR